MSFRTSRVVTLAASCLVLIFAGVVARPAENDRPPLATDEDPPGPFLKRGDYPEGFGRAVGDVLRTHRFTVPWLAVRGAENSIWFVAERIESAHRFDRLSLRVLSNGVATATITAYQFGPSTWATLGKLFADFGPEAREIATAVTNGIRANEDPRGPTLELHYGGEKALSERWVSKLYAKAVELLESSNFNSRAPLWQWNMAEVERQYRQTLAGNYLLISFQEPTKFTTTGGNVTVKEIIVGLPGGALFTIDDEDRLVGHAKYSGPLCVEFLKLVKEAVEQ